MIRQHHGQKKQSTNCYLGSYLENGLANGGTHRETLLGPRIHSLDLLFFQAKCIHPFFLRKVRKLAISCNGGGVSRLTGRLGSSTNGPNDNVHIMGTSGLVFQLASLDGELGKINWGGVKSVNRAIEKTIRAYRGVRVHLIMTL
jgi:hypothetical protein